MQNHPLNKVVFIQKVAAFTKVKSLKELFQLAYVNNSWNDTIKNYSFHLFEQHVRDIENVDELQDVCDQVIKSNALWFLDVLMSKALLDRVNVVMLVCKNEASTLDMMQLVFEKIVEVGGKDLLKCSLAANKRGWTCLMFLCSNSSTSPEVMKLLFEKIVEAGGLALVMSQLTATDDLSRTCLMLASRNLSSTEVINLIFEKIVEAGGAALLQSQLAATDYFGLTCLMSACHFSSSPDVVKLVLEKIVEAGGANLLKTQLGANCNGGHTCLKLGLNKHSSPEVTRLVAGILFAIGLFSEQYKRFDRCDTEMFRSHTGIASSSWTPDSESLAEVNKILKR